MSRYQKESLFIAGLGVLCTIACAYLGANIPAALCAFWTGYSARGAQ